MATNRRQRPLFWRVFPALDITVISVLWRRGGRFMHGLGYVSILFYLLFLDICLYFNHILVRLSNFSDL